MKHENNGSCHRCKLIFDKYTGFHVGLRQWFENIQKTLPNIHISCAGRGRQEQEELLARKASRAKYGKSAHNYNAAIDVFCIQENSKDIYPFQWFKKSLEPLLEEWIEWYGRKDAPFWELPHVEVKDWKALAEKEVIKLVE